MLNTWFEMTFGYKRVSPQVKTMDVNALFDCSAKREGITKSFSTAMDVTESTYDVLGKFNPSDLEHLRLEAVAQALLSDGTINWGRIISFACLCRQRARLYPSTAPDCAAAFTEFCDKPAVCRWMKDNGGWEGCVTNGLPNWEGTITGLMAFIGGLAASVAAVKLAIWAFKA
ncbi:hypothetical protein OA88_22810 [Flavobacterium sp. JRM]|nr:hypothetical protein OA88_22810 [Flavobacterium sp. JRM]